MSCNDVASVLDTHRSAQLAPAERAEVSAHLATCVDCAAAWAAQAELLALRVPAVPTTLLERALLASRLPQSAPARRARMPVIVGGILLAGAAAAAVTIVTMTRSPSGQSASSAEVELPATLGLPLPTAAERVPAVGDQEAAPTGDGVTSVELVETALSVAPIVRHPPDYPVEALEERLGGHVQVKFDVTAAGVVENVSVIESSDAQFEAAAVRAVSTWRYLPRIVAGKRVAATGVHTIIRWEPPKDSDPPPDQPETEARQEATRRAFAGFTDGLEVALNRLAADDLRGVELQLDQMLAVYPAAGFFHGDIWSFYGYLFTVQGNYDRAIDAYEAALASYARNGARPTMGPWVPLANLYFARHQYDVALKTLLRPRQTTNGTAPPGGSRLVGAEAEALIERLRALGVTEETL
jgi:TonB family protein